MKAKKKLINGLIIILLVISLAGCAAPDLQVKDMIPPIDRAKFVFSGRTLKVAPVKVLEKSYHAYHETDVSDFQEALIMSLNECGLFLVVPWEKSADYELYTELIGNKLLPGNPNALILFVNYRLVDSKTNQDIWKENIFSLGESDASAPGFITIIYKESIKENLHQLLSKLSIITAQLKEK